MNEEILQLQNYKETIKLELNQDEFKKLQKLLEIEKNKEKQQKENEEKRKNYNFIQLYRNHISEMRWLMTNHQLASSILFFILEHMDNRNALVCSYSIFEDYFKKHKTTIYRNLKILEENGFIDILKIGNSNVYVINEDLAWSDSNDKKKFAKYDGKILVSKKENKDYAYKNQFDKFKTLREKEKLK